MKRIIFFGDRQQNKYQLQLRRTLVQRNIIELLETAIQHLIVQLHRGWRWQDKTGGAIGFVLIFSLFLSFVSRQKKEKSPSENNHQLQFMKKLLYFLLISNSLWLTACSVSKQTNKEAKQTIFSDSNFIAAEAQKTILGDSNFMPAHVGISIYDPSTKQYLYNYQGDKYFVPASNMKLFTCYAAMKHLGDSLVGLRYQNKNEAVAGDSTIVIAATGDPTFLHPDFKNQLVADFLKINVQTPITLKRDFFRANSLGKGWAWDDYSDDYMVERSQFPIYGNCFHFEVEKDSVKVYPSNINVEFRRFDMVNVGYDKHLGNYTLKRDKNTNTVLWNPSDKKFSSTSIPFITSDTAIIKMIIDTLKTNRLYKIPSGAFDSYLKTKTIHSQPTDSLLKPMMHRSDNFFAEQTLLMVSNEKLGYMSDTKIIDSLLQTDFKSLPQKPKWVDGSGLSRYNLITPQDFVWVLNQMKNEFKWERISTILPTGNEGTLAGYYKNYVGKIYAKTGTLSNNVSLSGYITTKKGKQLIFSILVNNHQTSASNIRRTVEKFLTEIMEKN